MPGLALRHHTGQILAGGVDMKGESIKLEPLEIGFEYSHMEIAAAGQGHGSEYIFHAAAILCESHTSEPIGKKIL